jgi:hypothetical protein
MYPYSKALFITELRILELILCYSMLFVIIYDLFIMFNYYS